VNQINQGLAQILKFAMPGPWSGITRRTCGIYLGSLFEGIPKLKENGGPI